MSKMPQTENHSADKTQKNGFNQMFLQDENRFQKTNLNSQED